MKELTIAENKKVMIQLLDEVHRYCVKNDLKYYLSFGTLLGAVRHKGFIPWDDDIDIMMPRKDYDLFLEKFTSDLEYIKIASNDTEGYHFCWAKLYDDRTIKDELSVNYKNCKMFGVDIDIFPIDKIPMEDKQCSTYFKKASFYYYLLFFANSRYIYDRISIKRIAACLIFGTIGKLIGNRKIMRLFKENAIQYSSLNDNYRLNYTDALIAVFQPDDFNSDIVLPFEGKQYKCPSGYHNILTAMYGDYMKLPSETERVTHHSYKVYWKNNC